MNDKPRLVIKERFGTTIHGGGVHTEREPSVVEVVDWLRERGAVDYAAALSEADSLGIRENGHNVNGPTLRRIVDAALARGDTREDAE